MTLAPGIHYGVSFAAYADDPGVNRSLFDCPTPAHLRHQWDHGTYDSPSFRVGRALHAAVLEPVSFSDTVRTRPEFRGDGAHARRDAWNDEAATCGWTVLTASEMDTVTGMTAGIARHPEASSLAAKGHGHAEATCIWIDPGTGLRCKARIDRYIPTVLQLDVKTTSKIGPEDFAASFYNFGYHRQLAWYERGLAACGQAVGPWSVVSVESEAPYEAAAWVPHPDWLRLGHNECEAAVRRIAGWIRAGDWRGYSPKLETLEVPDWVRRKHKYEIGG